ncbi:MAG: S-layer homology domain-containing protein [Ignavibacteriales bacterium]
MRRGRFGWSILMVIVFTVGLIGGFVTPAKAFTDVKSGTAPDVFSKYISSKNIMKGYPDGTFKPYNNITRAELAAMLVKAKGLKLNKPAKATFKDVKPSHWAYGAVETAVKDGLLKGYKDGTFRPSAKTTRAELSALLLSLTREQTPVVALPKDTKDVKPSHWARKLIAAAIAADVVALVDGKSFAPEKAATRFEAGRGLALMLNLAPEYFKTSLPVNLKAIKGTVAYQEPGQAEIKVQGTRPCTAGATVTTGKDSEAQVIFPDGSNLFIKENSELVIKNTKGQSYIKKDGTQGTTIDLLEVGLNKGTIYGALGSSHCFKQEFNIGQMPWWKQAANKRVRVRVSMPWGTTEVKGSFWQSAVNSNGSGSTSLLEGSAQVIAGGATQILSPGQASGGSTDGGPPSAPTQMTPQQQADWAQMQAWVAQTLQTMMNNAGYIAEQPAGPPSVIGPPVPITSGSSLQVNP